MKEITQVVKDAVTKWCKNHNKDVNVILPAVKWDGFNKCFYFEANGMYHGVEEADGHIHT